MRALKRGGAHHFVSFDEQLPQAEAAMQATSHLSDMNSFDVAWASSIVTRAWKNVRDRFAVEGKQEVAKRLGTSVENFRVWLSRLRQTYRHALRAEVASTVSDPKEIDDELHYIYRILTA